MTAPGRTTRRATRTAKALPSNHSTAAATSAQSCRLVFPPCEFQPAVDPLFLLCSSPCPAPCHPGWPPSPSLTAVTFGTATTGALAPLNFACGGDGCHAGTSRTGRKRAAFSTRCTMERITIGATARGASASAAAAVPWAQSAPPPSAFIFSKESCNCRGQVHGAAASVSRHFSRAA
jgi:hypothetical protein